MVALRERGRELYILAEFRRENAYRDKGGGWTIQPNNIAEHVSASSIG